MGTNLSFQQEIVLQLVGPVAAAVLGTVIIGGIAQVVAREVQRRQADRKFREALVARISQIAYSIHYRLEHYNRWIRHSQPDEAERQGARQELERAFIEERVRLGALQNELDTYFGVSRAGNSLHRLSDLAMIKYVYMTHAPASQVDELSQAVTGPQHTGLNIDQLSDERLVQSRLTAALRDTLDGVLRDPLKREAGFKSTKILTGPDGRSRVDAPKPR